MVTNEARCMARLREYRESVGLARNCGHIRGKSKHLCDACLKIKNENELIRINQNKAAGLCGSCSKPKPDKNYQGKSTHYCKECNKKHATRRTKRESNANKQAHEGKGIQEAGSTC